MKFIAMQEKIKVPENASITGVVGFGPIPTGFGIEVELKIALPGMSPSEAKALVDKAHRACPYSNATRGNIDVRLTIL
jgi:osmotically inducible protein OsmC